MGSPRPTRIVLIAARGALALCGCAGIGSAVAAGPDGEGVIVCNPPRLAPDRALSPAPELIQGSLKNGLSYAIRPRAQPAGHVHIELAVRCGSMHEPDGASGAAALLARIPFGGTARFGPGEAIRFLDQFGIDLSRNENVTVDFDSTRYSLSVPTNDAPSITAALRFLADCAGGIGVVDEAVEKERRLLLSEERGRVNVRQRIVADTLPRILAGSRLAHHPPEGRAGGAADVTADHLRAMLADWWRPARMTLIIIGDVDPGALIERLSDAFSAIPDRRGPASPSLELVDRQELTPVITADPELWNTTAQWLAFQGPAPAVTRESEFRSMLVRDLAVEAMQRRLTRGVISGRLPVPAALAAAGVSGGVLRYTTMAIFDDRLDGLEAARLLGNEIGRTQRLGFLPGEAEDARSAIRAEAERQARAEPTLDPPLLADLIFGALRTSSVVLSASQRLELTTRLLPTITDEELSIKFRELTAPEHAAIILVLGQAGRAKSVMPSEDDLLALARASLSAQAAQEPDEPHPESFLDHELPAPGQPGAGRVTEMSIEPASSTVSALLGNGVRVHHRQLDDRTGQVRIIVTLGAGRIEETTALRGLTDAASAAWNWPAACSLSGVQIDSLRIGKDIRLMSRSGDDMVQVVMSADSAALPQAMRFLHLMLSEPRLEQAAFERWRWRQRSAAGYREADPLAHVIDRLPRALYDPSDARFAPITRDEIDALSLACAQRRLNEIVAAPMEVAITGDIRRAPALELAAQYLGSLPGREPLTPSNLGSHRAPSEPPGRGQAVIDRDLGSKQGACLIGFRADAIAGTDDELLLAIAQDILGTRLNSSLREEKQLASTLIVRSSAAHAPPEAGVLYVASASEPGNQCVIVEQIRLEIDRLASEGPTPDEFRLSLAAAMQKLADRDRRADQWAEAIADCAYRARPVAMVAGMPARASSLTAEQLRQRLARWNAPENRIDVRSLPAEAEQAP